ncbi:alpha/beta hydrolase [Candidatus Frankia alpina]|uniref:Alpha/beta hydrolase n=1 Tax=Candidatus Frankia alpina TaxID=2699483 RepID=A0A4S5ESD5_9ACTN|nr:alpha/beta family hydrolase [Candidatus Frankia alpina]THJ75331.1 alpha/beta hydrolase [Candidatus Frankia alpina]
MRGKSHTQGGSLTDSTLDHAVSFPAVSDRCLSAAPFPGAAPEPGAHPDGACLSCAHIAVDGGRLRVVPGTGASTVLFLHGAGSGGDTPLFDALAALLGVAGVRVARLEMPYRVAGRRAPDRPARLDAVATAAIEALGAPRPLALAGVSMGSRVAMRVAARTGVRAVLALGFPLQPPGTTAAGQPKPSRQGELDGAGVPVLVVQGDRDSFGRPAPDPVLDRQVHLVVGGDHSFRTRVRDGRPAGDAVAQAARVGAAFLLERLGSPAPTRESAAGRSAL